MCMSVFPHGQYHIRFGGKYLHPLSRDKGTPPSRDGGTPRPEIEVPPPPNPRLDWMWLVLVVSHRRTFLLTPEFFRQNQYWHLLRSSTSLRRFSLFLRKHCIVVLWFRRFQLHKDLQIKNSDQFKISMQFFPWRLKYLKLYLYYLYELLLGFEWKHQVRMEYKMFSLSP